MNEHDNDQGMIERLDAERKQLPAKAEKKAELQAKKAEGEARKAEKQAKKELNESIKEKNKRTKASTVVKLTESAMMITIAALLSMAKLIDMPYGGSVTMASMLPLVIIAYRHGLGWGVMTGFAYGLVQMALGAKNFSYLPAEFSYIATMVAADYLVAFAVLGFGGIFRRLCKRQATALALGSILVAVLRYCCHVISGWTVWASFHMDKAGLVYSMGYNATYMLPEMLILVVAAVYLGNTLDFRGEGLRPMPQEERSSATSGLLLAAGAIIMFGISFAVVNIFKHLQDADTGTFSKAGLSDVEWPMVIIVFVVCLAAGIGLLLARRSMKKKAKELKN